MFSQPENMDDVVGVSRGPYLPVSSEKMNKSRFNSPLNGKTNGLSSVVNAAFTIPCKLMTR